MLDRLIDRIAKKIAYKIDENIFIQHHKQMIVLNDNRYEAIDRSIKMEKENEKLKLENIDLMQKIEFLRGKVYNDCGKETVTNEED